jgi:uncharacterized delta-60 repeat protein
MSVKVSFRFGFFLFAWLVTGFVFDSEMNVSAQEFLTSDAVTRDGDFDPSFGTNGKTADAFYRGSDGLAVQPDGKIIVGGTQFQDPQFCKVLRLNPDGSPDFSFGGSARVGLQLGTTECRVHSIAVQPDGKILVGGAASSGTASGGLNFAVARLNADGSYDQTFNGNGRVIVDFFNSYDEAFSVMIQQDGRIVLAGFVANGPNNGSTYDFALIRLNPDGSFDNSFGVNGRVVNDISGTNNADRAFDAVLQSDGKIVMAGDIFLGAPAYYDFAVARFNTDGSIDNTFDGDGRVFTALVNGNHETAWKVAVQKNGKIIAGGRTEQIFPTVMDDDSALVRYNPNGSLDTTFDGDGKLVRDFSLNGEGDDVRALKVLTSGKIIFGASVPNPDRNPSQHTDLLIIRLLDSGQLDPNFGSGGKKQIDFADVVNPQPTPPLPYTGEGSSMNMVIQRDGKIVVSVAVVLGRDRHDVGIVRLLNCSNEGSRNRSRVCID